MARPITAASHAAPALRSASCMRQPQPPVSPLEPFVFTTPPAPPVPVAPLPVPASPPPAPTKLEPPSPAPPVDALVEPESTHCPSTHACPAGQTAPSHASTQLPFASQYSPGAHVLPTHASTTHLPSGWQLEPPGQPAHAHVSTHAPSTQTCPMSQ